MPKISAVILTLNEEKNIGRCIESVKDVADDIVVIDSFSTDQTEEICKAHGARFVQHPFRGHIEQKNWGITQAKYPHILSLDADEALSEKLKDSILKVKEDWEYDGYYFNRLTNYCGKWIKHNSWYPSRKLRLWDSRKGEWGGINPHDKFVLGKNTSQKLLKGDLLHYSYYTISDHVKQINTFSDILAKSYFDRGKKAGYYEIIFHTVWRFIRDYFIKLGFLDGFYGLIICINSSYETFLKYSKLKKLCKDWQTKTFKICFVNSLITWGGGEKEHFDLLTRFNEKKYQVIAIVNKKGKLYQKLKDKNIKIYTLSIWNLSFLNPFKIIKVCRILKRENVSTLFVSLSADLKIAGIAGKIINIKRIIYRRGNAFPIRNSFLNRFIYRKIITKVIANSNETKRCILANNTKLIDENKIEIVYNGIDFSDYNGHYDHIYTKQKEEIVLGNAGRLSKEKGQEYLMEIAKILKLRNQNFKILIAGSGKLEKRLKNKAVELDVADKIIFLGFINDIKSFNHTIDIFCMTSLFEGFGYVIVEAMALEKPVIAFNNNSAEEIIDNEETGFLVKKFDVKDYANKVELLINNKDLRIKLGTAGKQRAVSKFNIQRVIDRVEELIITG